MPLDNQSLMKEIILPMILNKQLWFCIENMNSLLIYGVHYTIYANHKKLKYIFTQKNLISDQRCQKELPNDYDLQIYYHPGKTKVVADALSKKAQVSLNIVVIIQLSLIREFEDFNVQVVSHGQTVAQLSVLSSMFNFQCLPYSLL